MSSAGWIVAVYLPYDMSCGGKKNDGVDAVGGSSLLTRVSQRHPHPTKQSVHLSSIHIKSVEFLREDGRASVGTDFAF
eukprot:scaffold9623_cov140-Skeletonema_dohrnii-CCMP3373.AAC.7